MHYAPCVESVPEKDRDRVIAQGCSTSPKGATVSWQLWGVRRHLIDQVTGGRSDGRWVSTGPAADLLCVMEEHQPTHPGSSSY